jgi:L-lysine exporter family protein LysE/ArgO
MSVLLAGFGLSLSIIVALGAQNAFVLRQGLRRERVGVVVAICTLSDILLIAAGVAGLGFLLERAPWLAGTTRWLGAAFLLAYALFAAWRALNPKGQGLLPVSKDGATSGPAPLGPVVLTALAMTWLNPSVYLDTAFLIGSVASSYGEARWLFAAGASIGSTVWFLALGYGARVLSPLLRTPASWRVLDAFIALLLVYTAVRLVVG